MTQTIKQSDPRAEFRRVYFTCVDATALQTRLQASDMGAFVVYLAKNGGALALAAAAAPTQIDAAHAKGVFYVELAIADIATPGRGTLVITNAAGTKAMEPREIDFGIEPAWLATVSSATQTSIVCDRTESAANYFQDSLVEYLTGSLKGQVKKIGSSAIGLLSLAGGYQFTAAGANGDVIEILSR